jgi:hypothetical protein
VPDIVAESLAVAVPVLSRHGDDSLKSDLLPGLAAGESGSRCRTVGTAWRLGPASLT